MAKNKLVIKGGNDDSKGDKIKIKARKDLEMKVKKKPSSSPQKLDPKMIRVAGLVIGLLLVVGLGFWLLAAQGEGADRLENATESEMDSNNDLIQIDANEFNAGDKKVGQDTRTLVREMRAQNVDNKAINFLTERYRPLMTDRAAFGGSTYQFFYRKGSDESRPVYMKYKPNKLETYTFKFSPPYKVSEEKNEVEIKEKIDDIIISATQEEEKDQALLLMRALVNQNINLSIIDSLDKILSWQVDLRNLKNEDRIKVIYGVEYVDEEYYRLGAIQAVYVKSEEKEVYAFRYENQGEVQYYDQLGRLLERSFLTSPISYAEISSPFNPNRKHPVTGEIKRHGGTDFAAPEGTPIKSVADGVVQDIKYTVYGGNRISVVHDDIYTTTYLHLSAYAENMTPGVEVKQGQVIGYVGATGKNITGPHVCFRFKKGDQEVNPFSEDLKSPEFLKGEAAAAYVKYKDSIIQRFQQLDF
ncbi:MAG: peptidoglycan DD-metalloendopeptidase family protein [Bacteroidota bacterium]